MVGGMERYFQIVRCFRDEDLRPNRQPEFTQLDLEASFIDAAYIYTLFEELTARIFTIGGIELPRPFRRMTWLEAMNTAGSDRPDLRFGMTFTDATDLFSETRYGFFLKALEFGAPPHGGIALGIDRVVAMILGTASIREVIAFPKNRSAFCPLTRAPSAVDPAQLAELGLLDLGGPDRCPLPTTSRI
ncbi:MAG: amino acid--tRNA ligase-related protein [Desulfosarcina sp.]